MTEIPHALLTETIETIERVGCQFKFCDGPTLEPVDMVTCYRCDTLAKLRQANGDPPRRDDEYTAAEAWDRWNVEYMRRNTGGRR